MASVAKKKKRNMQMNPMLWLLVRIAIVIFWICGGVLGGWPPVAMPIGWILLVGTVCVLWPLLGGRYLVLGIYRKLPADCVWLRPCWMTSPFHSEQPFQFFHLSGYSFLSFGVASLLRETWEARAVPDAVPSELFVGFFGLGMLIGMYWAIAAQRERFVLAARAPVQRADGSAHSAERLL